LLGSPRLKTDFDNVAGWLGFWCVEYLVPLFIKSVGVDLNGLFYTAAAIKRFSVRIIVGRASDRYGRGLFISICLYTPVHAKSWTASSVDFSSRQ